MTRGAAGAVEPLWLAHMVADLDEIEAEEERRAARRVGHPWRAVRWTAVRGFPRRLLRWLTPLAVLLTSACATTGATFRSGVGDAFLEHPPYYAGGRAAPSPATRIGHLAITYQRGATQLPSFDPAAGRGTPVDALLAEMNAFLDSLSAATGTGVRLVGADRASSVPRASAMIPPDVQFGCVTATGIADDDCAERGDSALGRGRQAMRLAVGRPSAEWAAWLRGAVRDASVEQVLVITLEVGQYLPRQVGWRGDKVVELGTSHVARLPWLTSLETPVTVLQLTGAVVDSTGSAIRVGAEGIMARRTRLAVSAVGGQELLGEQDVEAVRSLRRDDLAGRPLAWQVALRHLVAQLAGRPDVALPVTASR